MAKVSIFNMEVYQEFIREAIQQMPNSGRGELLRLAGHIGIHTSTLSQILARKKHLTLEQACAAADFFGLNELESRYFLLLVSRDRAGTQLLKKNFELQMAELRSKATDLKSMLVQDRPLTPEENAIFYSNWFYTAIWAQTSIPGFGNSEALQKHFNLPRKLVNEVISFLVRTGLCIEKKGVLSPGHQYTHLESASPLISRHHANWRIKAMERHPHLSVDELCYSSPMTLSKSDAVLVRRKIGELIAEVNKVREPSPSEELHCLNIDWIKV